MPELPEVETVVRGLQAVLPGKRIVDVRFHKTDFIDDPHLVSEHLPGKRITAVRRHGKFIVMELADTAGKQTALLVHLGMTGKLMTVPTDAPVLPHTHIFFSLDDQRELRYTDARRFGRVRFLEKGTGGSLLEELGYDPLEITESEFGELLSKRNARIKALLLDQRALRGMGNIYSDESLWWAGIHPARLASSLKDDEIHRLYQAMQKVLKEAIRLKGSSVSDYVDADGNRGEFQARHRVYLRTGEKCFRCRSRIERTIVGGRGTHFCPKCQRAPRGRATGKRTPRSRTTRKRAKKRAAVAKKRR